jgi:hypothetical protein
MGAVVEWTSVTGVGSDKLNEPFWIKAAVYDAPGTRLDITVGPGRADFGNPSGAKLTVQSADTHVFIASPAISTTYYVFLTPAAGAAVYRTSTSPTPQAGEACLGSCLTGNPIGSAVTRADLRGMLPVPSSSLTTAVGDIKPVAAAAALGALALGAPADHQHAQQAGVSSVVGVVGDIAPEAASAVAGASGRWADAAHVHSWSSLIAAVLTWAAAQTFSALATFNAGLTATASTFTGLLTLNAGLTTTGPVTINAHASNTVQTTPSATGSKAWIQATDPGGSAANGDTWDNTA